MTPTSRVRSYDVLFDQQFYEKLCGLSFKTKEEALTNYLREGEAEGYGPGPYFNTKHYQQQARGNASDGLLTHYCDIGFRLGLNPTRFFEQKWYGWQNPDYSITEDNPYMHYLTIGRAQGRDPSPLVDMVRYNEVIGAAALRDPYHLILDGMRSPAIGVYEDLIDLADAQRRFRDAISIYSAKVSLFRSPRRALVFLQCGKQSQHREWFTEEGREFDLLVNYYDHAGFDSAIGDHVFFQPGTKFTAISQLWRKQRELLLQYEHILFLDDDIMTSTPKLNRLFAICRQYGLDLAQMSLSSQSHCTWDLFFSQPHSVIRYVSGVEIMMPVLSRRALLQVGDDFERAVSGFGLDLLMGKKLLNAEQNNVAVVDEIVADHVKPIDQNTGSYYTYLRSNHINAKAELWQLITEFELDLGFSKVK